MTFFSIRGQSPIILLGSYKDAVDELLRRGGELYRVGEYGEEYKEDYLFLGSCKNGILTLTRRIRE